MTWRDAQCPRGDAGSPVVTKHVRASLWNAVDFSPVGTGGPGYATIRAVRVGNGEDSCGHGGNTGAHLHQSARTLGAGTHVFHNKDNGTIDGNRHLTGKGYPSGNISPPYPAFCLGCVLVQDRELHPNRHF